MAAGVYKANGSACRTQSTEVSHVASENSLWAKVVHRGHQDGRPKATPQQATTIEDHFKDAPQGWQAQVRRDLRIYPLYDALAMWIDGSTDLAAKGYIPKQTYDTIHTLGWKYADREL